MLCVLCVLRVLSTQAAKGRDRRVFGRDPLCTPPSRTKHLSRAHNNQQNKKSIEDASALRRRVSECFERAALPATPDEQRQKLLSFVIVGGGPTGVEVRVCVMCVWGRVLWHRGVRLVCARRRSLARATRDTPP